MIVIQVTNSNRSMIHVIELSHMSLSPVTPLCDTEKDIKSFGINDIL